MVKPKSLIESLGTQVTVPARGLPIFIMTVCGGSVTLK